METSARRRTSSLPRMTRRRLLSSSAARREVATRVSGAIAGDSTMLVAPLAVTNVTVGFRFAVREQREATIPENPLRSFARLDAEYARPYLIIGRTRLAFRLTVRFSWRLADASKTGCRSSFHLRTAE